VRKVFVSEKQNILVTGGTGYIGSHTVVELLAAGHDVFIIDNLCNSKASVLGRIERIAGQKHGSIFETGPRCHTCSLNTASTQ